ncbi:2-oxoacid:ferredoxin oxidoreductase subunit beta [Fulvivirga sedimenti]|uniref:2-oxoacid:ferredoxin oxidoreductase subunit beta n=1 Tax=Fulvivirga sedimenti TaxID=2879465 RepID=A0A9X1HU39_9BACT|nr:2-oxoacid:ferredoxin oxidoreductase subunit beta [Fulvivirga sedimenti]MCA6078343.1 2-oxoacid:ferredoxin oxidoreductase subunit beta [Fulvivirga sedimenti]
MKVETKKNGLTPKDYASDQDIRWCPGCGDYSIIKQVQTVLPTFGIPKEKTVFISGIGCSSRYPYYMNTYGMHGIHGRAIAIASGVKATNPDLDVWVITGDGDGLSIGGNHLIHGLRKNFDINILLFNNEIYGLTKGQYSPTSPTGKVTKSTPYGSVDMPFNPIALALGAEGTFVARAIDRNPVQLREILTAAHAHKGASFLEIYQNCIVFNDKAFDLFTNKETKDDHVINLVTGEPLTFSNGNKGIVLDGFTPRVVDLDVNSVNDCWIHDPSDKIKASILSRFFDYSIERGSLPRPFGIFYQEDRPTYEQVLEDQLKEHSHEPADLDALLSGSNSWEIK